MKFKSVLFFVLLVAIVASFSFISCHKNDPENDGYSDWTEVIEADLDVFAKARAAYLDDPANATAPEYEMMKSLSEPYAVRTKAVENGMNYQFAFTICAVTIHKSDGDEVGKVIEIQGASDGGPGPGLPPPPTPVKRDTLID